MANSPDDIDAIVDRALAEMGLDPTYRSSIRRLHDCGNDQWRNCCGSGCDPCVETLGRAVDRVRTIVRARQRANAEQAS